MYLLIHHSLQSSQREYTYLAAARAIGFSQQRRNLSIGIPTFDQIFLFEPKVSINFNQLFFALVTYCNMLYIIYALYYNALCKKLVAPEMRCCYI